MGADLIAAHLVIDAKKVPDWAAAEAAIRAMTVEQLRACVEAATGEEAEVPDDITPEEIEADLKEYRHQVLGALSYVKGAYEDNERGAFSIEVRGAKVLVTGGMSWGDPPAGVQQFCIFAESPGHAAAGFE